MQYLLQHTRFKHPQINDSSGTGEQRFLAVLKYLVHQGVDGATDDEIHLACRLSQIPLPLHLTEDGRIDAKPVLKLVNDKSERLTLRDKEKLAKEAGKRRVVAKRHFQLVFCLCLKVLTKHLLRLACHKEIEQRIAITTSQRQLGLADSSSSYQHRHLGFLSALLVDFLKQSQFFCPVVKFHCV